jgi:hypothetical protein
MRRSPIGRAESVVMRMSGHMTRAMFERYNLVAEEDLRDAVYVKKLPKLPKRISKDPKTLSVSAERA